MVTMAKGRPFRSRKQFKVLSVVSGLGKLTDITGRSASESLTPRDQPVTDDFRDVASEIRSISDDFRDTIRSESRSYQKR